MISFSWTQCLWGFVLACQSWKHTEAIWAREWQNKNVFWWKFTYQQPWLKGTTGIQSQCGRPSLLKRRFTLSVHGELIPLPTFLPCYLSLSYWFIGAFLNIKDRSYYIYCKFFGHLIICLVTLWSCKYIGALIAYIFSFTVSMVGALLREALSKPKIIFLQSIIFWYIYYLFFILRSHIHLECVQ